MATTLTRGTSYVDPAVWQAFREACVHRRISASAQLAALIDAQLQTWQDEKQTRAQR
jgi:hypothetical protein